MENVRDLVQYACRTKLPVDFRQFDKHETELLMICYARYIQTFLRASRVEISLPEQLTIDDFVRKDHFSKMIEAMTYEENL